VAGVFRVYTNDGDSTISTFPEKDMTRAIGRWHKVWVHTNGGDSTTSNFRKKGWDEG